MKKVSLREKFSYNFDKIMSKGPISLVIMLFVITAIVVCIAGILIFMFSDEYPSIAMSIWMSLMHALDAGNLAGSTSSLSLIILMTLVTICGLFITSMLIGIINTGLQSKLENLRKGKSRVVESGHSIILGFNSRIFTVLSELIIANENQKNAKILIMGEEDKEEMENQIREYISDFKTTDIICRTGSSSDFASLAKCSLETCKSVIVNELEDFMVIKSILAVTNVLKGCPSNNAHITAVVDDEKNVQAAKIAGEGKVEIVYFKSAISRIIAHTCRQPGLSTVYTELFDFDGDEIYLENIPEVYGKKFGEILNSFEVSSVIGIKSNNKILVNPPMDTLIHQKDEIIVIAADDGVTNYNDSNTNVDKDMLVKKESVNIVRKSEKLLILGYNELLEDILVELDNYIAPNSLVKVAYDIENELDFNVDISLKNINLIVDKCNIFDRRKLEELTAEGFFQIVVLSSLNSDIQEADAKTLLLLLHLRNIAEIEDKKFNITSEMLDVKNQELAKITKVNDFVVSSNLTSLITAQISENRFLGLIFDNILDSDGSEIYIKPITNYINISAPVNGYTLTYAASQKNEICIGYKLGEKIVTNPSKNTLVTFTENDFLIVLAEDE